MVHRCAATFISRACRRRERLRRNGRQIGKPLPIGGFLMGSLVVRILGAVGAVLLLMTIFGSGVASADPYAGKTYDEAAAKIAEWNGKPVVGR